MVGMTESTVEPFTEMIPDAAKTGRIRVLHVDDDLTFLSTAKQCLEMQGEIDVDTVSSVNEALEKLKKTDYEVVVSDYRMPDRDGLEFLKELREKGNTVPFIVFTGRGREKVAIKALNLGADRYIDKHGDPETVYCELAHAIRQAVDRKSTQIELLKREAKLHAILESSPEAITVVDLSGTIVDCNPATLDVHGYTSKSEVIGRHSFDLVSKKDHKRASEDMKRTLEQGSTKNMEYTATKKDGSEFPAEISGSVIKDSSGTPISFVSITKDITERKKAEEKLWSLKEFTERIFDSIADPLLVIDTNDHRIISANEAALKQLLLRKEYLVGKTCYETTHHRSTPCEPPLHICPIQEVLKTGKTVTIEHTHFDKDNNEILSEVSVHPVRNQEGNIVQAVHLARNVTERGESEEKFRVLAEQSPNMVFMNKRGKVVYANKRCEEIVGYRMDELCSPDFDFLTLIAPESIDPLELTFRRHMEGKYVAPYECTLLTKEGKRITAIITTNLITYKGEKTILGVITDITEHKKAEEEKSRLLRDLQERVKELNCLYGMSKLVEKSGISLDDILQGTADLLLPAMHCPGIVCGRIVVENREFSTKNFKATRWKLQTDIKVFGKKAGFAEVRYLEEPPTIAEGPFLKEERHLIRAIAERLGRITERKKAEDALEDAKQKWSSLTENTNDVVMIVDSEGTIQYINRTIPPYTPKETIGKTVYEYVPRDQHETLRSSLQKTYETGESLSFVVSSSIPKIGTVWFRTKVVPVKDDEKTVSAILMSTDITELRNTEERLKELNKKLETVNEKLHVVGGLTRHDVNNKLAAVTGNVYLARKKLPVNSEVLDYLKQIEASVEQTVRIFDFAKAYEMLGAEELAYVDVEKAVDEAVSLFPTSKDVKVVNDCHGLTVLADSLLRQLFYNLVDNSLKYGENLSWIKVHYEEKKGGHLKVIYEDNGVGVPPDAKPKLFDEGYTTGKGSGYGLYLVKKMLEVYGWTIQETGMLGKGAQFTMTIPEGRFELS